MGLYDHIQEAVAGIRSRAAIQPAVGVILGSGLGAFAAKVERPVKISYQDIPHFPTSSVVGHAGELILGTIRKVPTAIMSGRVHYYEGYPLETVGFPVRVLAGLGVKSLVVTNAAGAVNPTFAPGDFMVIVDHINLTGANPLRGVNDERLGPRFPDMSSTYFEAGRKAWHDASREVGIALREGVYCGLAGPSYETPAEIRMLQRIGADTVGMSTVAEAIVAAHAGIKVAGLSVVTNRAAGLSSSPLSHDEVKEVGARVQGALCDLLSGVIGRLG
ncbi:MAG: purine-nucleoside phosphorylase [Deltaproteobacteria bacterium]|nr:purine-nucleoside phosphorylase [Deltaproteobacteria bacterium]